MSSSITSDNSSGKDRDPQDKTSSRTKKRSASDTERSNEASTMTEHHRVVARREANRMHAMKSRQRSKTLFSELQASNKILAREKAELERQVVVLRAQIDVLSQQNQVLMQSQSVGGSLKVGSSSAAPAQDSAPQAAESMPEESESKANQQQLIENLVAQAQQPIQAQPEQLQLQQQQQLLQQLQQGAGPLSLSDPQAPIMNQPQLFTAYNGALVPVPAFPGFYQPAPYLLDPSNAYSIMQSLQHAQLQQQQQQQLLQQHQQLFPSPQQQLMHHTLLHQQPIPEQQQAVGKQASEPKEDPLQSDSENSDHSSRSSTRQLQEETV
jgi:hypothetical protein